MTKKNQYKIVAVILVALIIVLWIAARPYRVAGDCMEPAIKDGQLCFVNQLSPFLRQYKVNDIITFDYEGRAWIARVVALETDTIQITAENIILNGSVLSDGEIHRDWSDWKYGSYGIDNPFQVPSGHVFVLSDKLSAHHDDSRVFGPISTKSITGLVW